MRRRVLLVFLALFPVFICQPASAQQWNGTNGQQFGAPGGFQQMQQQQFQPLQPQISGQMVNGANLPMSNGIGFQQGFASRVQPPMPISNSQVSTITTPSQFQQQPMPAQYAPSVPGTAGEPGVDILDESLKYHNLGAQNPGLNRNFNQNQSTGGFSAVTQNGNAGSPSTANPNASLMSKPLFGNAGLFQAAVGGTPTGTSGGGGGMNTQAIGAVGAAALLGTFLTNGGVGGMMKSVGWDNSRHMRGAVAGQ